MTKELISKVVEEFKARGVEPYWINHMPNEKYTEMPTKTIHVHETFRRNHRDMDNVTVTIEVTEWSTDAWHLGTTVSKIKVPKDASDAVISNRVSKTLDCMK